MKPGHAANHSMDLSSEFERANSTQQIKQTDKKNLRDEEQKLNRVQDTMTVVKSNSNANPALFGQAAPTQTRTNANPDNYNPFAQNTIGPNNNGVKTPQIFVENKAPNNAPLNSSFNPKQNIPFPKHRQVAAQSRQG